MRKSMDFPLVFLTILVLSSACSLFSSEVVQPTEVPDEPDFGPTGGPIKFLPDNLPTAQMDTPYETEIRITLNNTPVDEIYISDGILPAGLELIRVEGDDAAILSGTPTESGAFQFTVSAWCFGTQVDGQDGSKEYTLVVNP